MFYTITLPSDYDYDMTMRIYYGYLVTMCRLSVGRLRLAYVSNSIGRDLYTTQGIQFLV